MTELYFINHASLPNFRMALLELSQNLRVKGSLWYNPKLSAKESEGLIVIKNLSKPTKRGKLKEVSK